MNDTEPKTMEGKLGGERDDMLLTGVCGGSKHHDLNSRSIKKLNAEEEEEEEEEEKNR